MPQEHTRVLKDSKVGRAAGDWCSEPGAQGPSSLIVGARGAQAHSVYSMAEDVIVGIAGQISLNL